MFEFPGTLNSFLIQAQESGDVAGDLQCSGPACFDPIDLGQVQKGGFEAPRCARARMKPNLVL